MGYHHVTTVEARRLIFLAGQCPLAAGGVLPAGPPAQVNQVVATPALALAAVGAKPANVVRTVIHGASADRSELSAAWDRFTGSAIVAAFTTAGTRDNWSNCDDPR